MRWLQPLLNTKLVLAMNVLSNESGNLIIPKKSELVRIIQNHYPTGHREDSHKGTNCSGEILIYIKDGVEKKFFVKKSFLRFDSEGFEEEYRKIKKVFRNIVPNQGFVSVGGIVFAFCVPICIKIDVLQRDNRSYLIKILMEGKRLLRQLKFFIGQYEKLLNEGLVLDLHGSENLVISNDDRLYYVDSFLVFHESDSIRQESIKNLEFLKRIVEEVGENKAKSSQSR